MWEKVEPSNFLTLTIFNFVFMIFPWYCRRNAKSITLLYDSGQEFTRIEISGEFCENRRTKSGEITWNKP